MIKETVNNPRYPHLVVITRLVVDDNPFDEREVLQILYKGEGHSYTDTTTTGDAKMDYNRRKTSIPVRFDEWKQAVLDGDRIAVKIGEYTEIGIVRDFEADNDRTMIYWEYGRT